MGGVAIVEQVARELCRWEPSGYGPIPYGVAVLMARKLVKMVQESKKEDGDE